MSLSPAPTLLEARLSWLISKSGITQPRPDRRLNAIENVLCGLAKQWRGWVPIVPELELRRSKVTRDELFAWIEECAEASGETCARMAIYASGTVIEPSASDGWIRVLVGGARQSLSFRRRQDKRGLG